MSLTYPCIYCTEDLHCTKFAEPGYESWCILGPCSAETPSNGDLLRRMTDKKLAELIGRLVDHGDCDQEGCVIKQAGMCGWPDKGCDESALEWLTAAAEGENGTL